MEKKDYERFIVLLYISNGTKTLHRSDYFSFSFPDFFSLSRGKTLCDIGAYCLMPNHFHLLVRENIEGGISLYIQKLLTAYTMYFNKKYDRRGTLFEGPFRATHADSDQYLKYLFSYIHLNPIKLFDPRWRDKDLKNVPRAEQFLSEFSYSSYSDYTGHSRPQAQILHREAFPDYFQNPRDFKEMIREWLAFSHQDDLPRQGVPRQGEALT